MNDGVTFAAENFESLRMIIGLPPSPIGTGSNIGIFVVVDMMQ
jgi:hypothetical protein